MLVSELIQLLSKVDVDKDIAEIWLEGCDCVNPATSIELYEGEYSYISNSGSHIIIKIGEG